MKNFKVLPKETETEENSEKSKFFGSPSFPNDFLERNNLNDDFFLMQLNLSELEEKILPSEGFIYIFLKIDNIPVIPKVFYSNLENTEIYENINEEFNMQDSSAIFIEFDDVPGQAGSVLKCNDTEVVLLEIDTKKMPTTFPNFCHQDCKIVFTMNLLDLKNLDFSKVKMQIV